MTTWTNCIPKPVLDKINASGKTGVEWIERLDHLIYTLEKRWKIEVIKVLEGGTHAFIGEAITQSNKRVILKLSMPEMIGETEFENEIKALELADVNGYVQLLSFIAPQSGVHLTTYSTNIITQTTLILTINSHKNITFILLKIAPYRLFKILFVLVT